MNGPRAFGFGLLLALALAAFFMPDASAQLSGGDGSGSTAGGPGNGGVGGPNGGGMGGGGMGGGRRGGQSARNHDLLPDQSASPRATDPEGRDAIELYSRLCVSTRGNREQATGIIGDADSAIEKLTEGQLRGLEGGKPGGVGWIIRMPLGDRIIIEFTGDGTCIVRAPRTVPSQIEAAFQDLLNQYSASSQFDVRRGGETTKAFDQPGKPETNDAGAKDERHAAAGKLKVHFIFYTMHLPDTGRTAELGIATTDSREAQIQATMTYLIRPENAGAAAGGSGR
jgi:hypothetical protein